MTNFLFHRVQLRIEEKLNLSCGRDGGLQNLEVHGLMTLFITDEAYGRVRVQVRFIHSIDYHQFHWNYHLKGCN